MSHFKDTDKILNPNRSIGYKIIAKNLLTFKFPQIIDFFKNRLLDFYFMPIEILIKKTKKKYKSNLGFIIIAQCSMIIDVLSSYHHPDKKSVKDRFLEFLKTDFKHGFEKAFIGHGKYKLWGKKNNESFTDVISTKNPSNNDIYGKSIAWVFYKAFRNGIIHNTNILSYGGYIYNQTRLYDYGCWIPPNNGFELSINPLLLFKELLNYLNQYIMNLKNFSDSTYDQYRENFKIKFRFDFGYSE